MSRKDLTPNPSTCLGSGRMSEMLYRYNMVQKQGVEYNIWEGVQVCGKRLKCRNHKCPAPCHRYDKRQAIAFCEPLSLLKFLVLVWFFPHLNKPAICKCGSTWMYTCNFLTTSNRSRFQPYNMNKCVWNQITA